VSVGEPQLFHSNFMAIVETYNYYNYNGA